MDRQFNACFMKLYNEYCNMVYRICFSFMKNKSDAEDAVSEIFLKLIQSEKEFESEEHAKAWLIVTSSNYCKDQLKLKWRRNRQLDEVVLATFESDSKVEVNEILESVLQLPTKYKMAIYLYYYEGYNSIEIGKILGKSASAVRNDLQKAKKLLKVELE